MVKRAAEEVDETNAATMRLRGEMTLCHLQSSTRSSHVSAVGLVALGERLEADYWTNRLMQAHC